MFNTLPSVRHAIVSKGLGQIRIRSFSDWLAVYGTEAEKKILADSYLTRQRTGYKHGEHIYEVTRGHPKKCPKCGLPLHHVKP